jgi:hypothetical protein
LSLDYAGNGGKCGYGQWKRAIPWTGSSSSGWPLSPPLTREDEAVLGEIHQMRRDLRHVLRTPRRWEGVLRRSALARAIRGSNSIEGYVVDEDDAAALDGEEPISADEQTFLEIQGYRQALGYVLAMGDAEYATFDATEIRAMHYMMLAHDHSRSPGRYRRGPVYAHDEHQDRVVYEGPDAARIPALMDALVGSLHTGFYVAAEPLRLIRHRRRQGRRPLRDPYPWMPATLSEPAPRDIDSG